MMWAFVVLALEELAIWLIVRKTLGPIDWSQFNKPFDPTDPYNWPSLYR
jgi:hypothetical protein